jgi:hypothetical protein
MPRCRKALQTSEERDSAEVSLIGSRQNGEISSADDLPRTTLSIAAVDTLHNRQIAN